MDYVQFLIESDASIDYDHPIFTLNAFAFSDEDQEVFLNFGLLPDKIVMGDGILDAYAELGLDGTASDLIYAHEFAHHVQYELQAFGPYTPEATRRTELMADGFAAYYLGHARGARFRHDRLEENLLSSREIGDCAFSNPGHHGTPNQREKAVQWGIDTTESAANQGHIYSSQSMVELFDAALPVLIAPDAP